jgi:GxxExxY protein
VSKKIIAVAFVVHKELGYGFVEKVYKNALAIELGGSGLKCAVEVPLKVLYHGKTAGDYYADMIVDDKIIVEVKAVGELAPIHEVQLVNYLKATGLHVGLLINFGKSVKVKRRIFGYDADED